jgi:hypothetical protein
MRHVTKIEANLKCGVSAVLSPKTLIVGPNASGKSAIVNAVELATSGTASDVQGRLTATADGMLRMLVPPGVDSGRAHAALDDATTAEWVIGGGRATRTGAEAHFPLREVYENLLGTPETARKWLLRLIGKADLPTIVESLKRQAKGAQDQAKTLRNAATAQAQGLPPEPTEGEIATAKAQSTAKLLADAEAALTAMEAALSAADAKMKSTAAALATAPVIDGSTVETGTAMVKILNAQVAAGAVAKCGLCLSPTSREKLVERSGVIAGRIEGTRAALAQRADLDAAAKEAWYEFNVAKADAERALETRNALRKVGESVGIPEDIVRRQAAWVSVRKLRAQAEQAEIDAATMAAKLKTEAENMERAASDALQVFVDTVQAYLPPGDEFAMTLDPVRFGLKVNGGLRCALSGAEWARVTAALASAVAVARPNDFSIVVPEERAFDPVTLEKVLRAFSGVPCQVLLASPIEPVSVPEGWTVVRVGVPVEIVVKEPESKEEPEGAVKIELKLENPALDPVVEPVVEDPPKKKRGRPSNAEKAARATESPESPPPADVPPVVHNGHVTTADMIVYAREHPKAKGSDLQKVFPGVAYNRACEAVEAAKKDPATLYD